MDNPNLTTERLKELLNYDAETGIFTRKVRTSNRINVGDIAGSVRPDGYIAIRLEGKKHKAHRLAWLYVYGKWPKHEIDHINGNPSDNRIENLRDIPHSQNVKNTRKPRKDNLHGYMGVTKNFRQWIAKIQIDGVSKVIGAFDCPHKAHAAYVEAKRKYHLSCTI